MAPDMALDTRQLGRSWSPRQVREMEMKLEEEVKKHPFSLSA